MRKEVAELHEIPLSAVDFVIEPIARSDGYRVGLVTDTTQGSMAIISFVGRSPSGLSTTLYQQDTVEKIGEGDYGQGILKLTRALCSATIDDLLSDDRYPFAHENNDYF